MNTTVYVTGKPWHIALWVTQGLLALLLTSMGLFKLTQPVADIAALWPWTGESPALLRFTGLVDIGGGLGLVLPMLTHIRPRLTVWAAWGCALLMASAIVFHLARGEAANTPFNFMLLALIAFVIWGRTAKVPVQ